MGTCSHSRTKSGNWCRLCICCISFLFLQELGFISSILFVWFCCTWMLVTLFFQCCKNRNELIWYVPYPPLCELRTKAEAKLNMGFNIVVVIFYLVLSNWECSLNFHQKLCGYNLLICCCLRDCKSINGWIRVMVRVGTSVSYHDPPSLSRAFTLLRAFVCRFDMIITIWFQWVILFWIVLLLLNCLGAGIVNLRS